MPFWVPVPSLQNVMTLSFSLPAIRGSSASKIPSSLESNPAFSYFQGVLVKRSTSFLLPFLFRQPVRERPAAINRVPVVVISLTMVRFVCILLCLSIGRRGGLQV